MKEKENIPDRAQRERVRNGFRMIKQSGICYFHSLMSFSFPVSARSRRQVDRIIVEQGEEIIFWGPRPSGEKRDESEERHREDKVDVSSMSTASTDPNGPFIYTYNKRDDAESVVSTVSSVTFHESIYMKSDNKGLESGERGPGVLLGALEEKEDEEEIIFKSSKDLPPLDEDHTAFLVSKPNRQSTIDAPDFRDEPLDFRKDVSAIEEAAYLVNLNKDSTDSVSIPCKSTESLSSNECNSISRNEKMVDGDCLKKDRSGCTPRRSAPIWSRCFHVPARDYSNTKGGDEKDPENQLWTQEFGRVFKRKPIPRGACGPGGDDYKCWALLAVAALLVVSVGVIGVVLVFVIVPHAQHNVAYAPTDEPTPDTSLTTSRIESLRDLIGSLSGYRTVDDPSQPQHAALDWIANIDGAKLNLSSTRYDTLVERYVVSLLYFATKGEAWTTQNGFLSPTHVCEWNSPNEQEDSAYFSSGIICDDDGNVLQILLGKCVEVSHLMTTEYLGSC
jgi:hypothetical protein